MQQDPVQQLFDLIAVNSFYITVLEDKLQFAVPLPLEAKSPDQGHAEQAIAILHRWLAVLDFAIAPITVRDALRGQLPPETAVALLRYYVGKKSGEETDRDKADCVATFLYRESDISKKPIPQTNDRYHFIMQCVKDFENTMVQTVGDVEPPELTLDAKRLLQEFEFLHQEVEDFRTFDQLMDSQIVQRVRDLKQSFGIAFYHPSVLTNVAAYNFMFGKRFDRLFAITTEQIKNFAAVVQEEGASIMSKLDGDVIVKHLADVEGQDTMRLEYGKAQEHFRKISRFKKVVDQKEKGRPQSRSTSSVSVQVPPAAAETSGARSSAAEKAASAKSLLDQLAAGNQVEDSKIRSQYEQLTTLMKKAEKSRAAVPAGDSVVALSIAEAEALRAEYGAEKSFRADYAAVVSYLIAVLTVITMEQQDFTKKQASSHMWKPHFDSLNYIVQASTTYFRVAGEILKMAEQRGLAEKAKALDATGMRLQKAIQQVQAMLQAAKSQTA
jgi:hypothetical protein